MQKSGKARAIGVSDYSIGLLKETVESAKVERSAMLRRVVSSRGLSLIDMRRGHGSPRVCDWRLGRDRQLRHE